ncbi:hypothetical protein AEA42_04210 [Shewanella sp. Sh95]|uniref:PD-(D/E)XK nuclease family protein n=1 Tax=Shewanella sp. Sh95 TaxID=1689868 RepID=UPI0006DA481F|nr:PD-(D/E)XK nuclease family protein [Shewanella sp. Sh95]KPN78245.1 hypothetical protein AEA42_04210 [Shewanella sp. Sh95]
MLDSLLVNVSKYAASHQTSPIENFITEAFAWLLKHDSVARKALSELLVGKLTGYSHELSSIHLSNDIETQVNFGGKYPDLLWTTTDDDFCLIFEHKVWSELHDQQLNNYRNYATSHLNKPFKIVLITAHIGQHRQSPDIALCWYDIAGILQTLIDGDAKASWLRDEFISLLKSNGLVNSTPLNPLTISYYNDVKNIDKQLYEMVSRCELSQWPICQSTSPDIKFLHPPRNKTSRGRYDAWGRIGLEFSYTNPDNNESGWIPGVFCGFVVDGDDHLVHDLLTDGPIAAVIISVNSKLQPLLKSNGCYDQLLDELKETLTNGWSFSDRTRIGKKFNSWHPLIIYKGLASFLGDASTLDTQTACYFDQMSFIQTLLVGSKSFANFCVEMRRLNSTELDE